MKHADKMERKPEPAQFTFMLGNQIATDNSQPWQKQIAPNFPVKERNFRAPAPG